MEAHPEFVIALRLVWVAVIGYWVWGASNVKTAVRTESQAKRLILYILPLGLATLLLGPGDWFGRSWLRERFVAHSVPIEATGLAICATGAVLACYARGYLGRNWSGSVQLKQDHELIRNGPYRYVRHPIYTGFLLLFFGTAVMVGDWRGLLAVAIVLASFWRKLRLEERWLTQHFGDRYLEYVRQTKALVPGLL